MHPSRLTIHEVEGIRRSFAATRELTEPQAFALLAELEAVLVERDQLRTILERLSAGAWPELRALLTEMHRVLHPSS